MTLVVSGLSHHTSTLALRERLMPPHGQLSGVLTRFQEEFGISSGVAIVHTCNRLEVYVCAGEAPEVLHQRITGLLSLLNQLDESEFVQSLYHYANADAVRHLFRVAASLDSMVVGETEIMFQIQRAYDEAREADTMNRMLSMLFERAQKCGKRVRTETRIGAGKVSVASIAVDLAETVLKSLRDKTVMVIGSGQVSELVLKNLADRGIEEVMVLNRTLEHAQSLAERYQGEAIALDAIHHHLYRADIVISSTGAPEVILNPSDFERALESRGRTPMFVIDIAVPRDIDPDVADIDSVYYYDLDDLQVGAESNLSKRQSEICACNEIVEAEVTSFNTWCNKLHAEPVIVALTKRYHEIRQQELDRTLKKLNGISPEVRHEIECLSRRIINILLQQPIAGMKTEINGERREHLLPLAQSLFALEDLG